MDGIHAAELEVGKVNSLLKTLMVIFQMYFCQLEFSEFVVCNILLYNSQINLMVFVCFNHLP